ncbi:hypothetical protein K469DRAFT_344141 [Zopfia rhizophila CBS 207.26]|uniref:Uncharacterized protein n=1 Tax=Zopfia rhizophila CBS 207.26 TaxID=1314779 RepID=A0A6A6EPM8_9PEZI|nr:hypothetical protein K469DRAFT_344141 [Zopfia rhizophila CBS 207.26]
MSRRLERRRTARMQPDPAAARSAKAIDLALLLAFGAVALSSKAAFYSIQPSSDQIVSPALSFLNPKPLFLAVLPPWRATIHIRMRRLQGPPMSGRIARVSTFPYKSTIFHTNLVSAVAHAILPLMGGPCRAVDVA